MNAILRLVIGSVGLATLLLAGNSAAADDKPVTETDKLQFTQKQVQALMQELQERMFHLAELTKQAEPDNSTRLVLALRKAREQLIVEEMREILERARQERPLEGDRRHQGSARQARPVEKAAHRH